MTTIKENNLILCNHSFSCFEAFVVILGLLPSLILFLLILSQQPGAPGTVLCSDVRDYTAPDVGDVPSPHLHRSSHQIFGKGSSLFTAARSHHLKYVWNCMEKSVYQFNPVHMGQYLTNRSMVLPNLHWFGRSCPLNSHMFWKEPVNWWWPPRGIHRRALRWFHFTALSSLELPTCVPLGASDLEKWGGMFLFYIPKNPWLTPLTWFLWMVITYSMLNTTVSSTKITILGTKKK